MITTRQVALDDAGLTASGAIGGGFHPTMLPDEHAERADAVVGGGQAGPDHPTNTAPAVSGHP